MRKKRRTWQHGPIPGSVEFHSPGAKDPFDVIHARLRPFPQARVETYANGLEVQPLDALGFPVTFAQVESGIRVTCDGWYSYFASPDQALKCFFQALSPAARLRVTIRGTTRCRWRLELESDNGWTPLIERARLVIPFWRRPAIHYLQNRLLEAA